MEASSLLLTEDFTSATFIYLFTHPFVLFCSVFGRTGPHCKCAVLAHCCLKGLHFASSTQHLKPSLLLFMSFTTSVPQLRAYLAFNSLSAMPPPPPGPTSYSTLGSIPLFLSSSVPLISLLISYFILSNPFHGASCVNNGDRPCVFSLGERRSSLHAVFTDDLQPFCHSILL